jgi:hypothetical protein
VGARKFRHSCSSSDPIYVDDGFSRSVYVADGIFHHLHVVLLRFSTYDELSFFWQVQYICEYTEIHTVSVNLISL